MKIAFTCHMLYSSGVGTHIRGLAAAWERLREQGESIPDLHFIGETSTMKTFPTLERIGTLHQNSMPEYSWRWRLLYPHLPGVAGTHYLDYDIPAYLRKQPYVISAHDMTPFLRPEFYPFNFHPPTHKYLVLKILRGARHIMTLSQNSANDIIRMAGVRAEKITVVPCAVDTAWQRVEPGEVAEARACLHVPQNYFLAVGVNLTHKNYRWLIDSFVEWQGYKGSALVIAGARNHPRFDIDAYIREKGLTNIINLGYVDHRYLPALYQGARALIFPSLAEGFGIPIIEAQRLGVPVLASQASCIPEVAGDGAFYFDPQSASELHNRLDEILDASAARTLIERGYSNERKYSWEDSARITSEVYERYLG